MVVVLVCLVREGREGVESPAPGDIFAARDLWRLPSPRTHLDQVACLVQSSFACLQG